MITTREKYFIISVVVFLLILSYFVYVNKSEVSGKITDLEKGTQEVTSMGAQVGVMKNHIKQLADSIKHIQGNYADKVSNIDDDIEGVEDTLSEITDVLNENGISIPRKCAKRKISRKSAREVSDYSSDDSPREITRRRRPRDKKINMSEKDRAKLGI